MRKKKKLHIHSLSKEERLARALEIYNNAPETVRTPAQQKAYERSMALKSNEEGKNRSIHIKNRRPRARIISGGMPSLGKRQ